ncbi:protein late bloomer [Drosophila erecta]|uniref:Tetraspanin n=1 Tax=Drosophila erecta TaxID=7220 RepID=B3NFC2_DROER|nr:protein late bloomer [Drosophila erecta]EDV50464.2 uncharacterized protein Dere_GG14432 [Drosophila erecta]
MVDNQETRGIPTLYGGGKLIISKVITFCVWAVNFILTCADIYIYYFMLKEYMDCWNCLFRSYMIIALTINFLMVPLLILGGFFIYLELASAIRIYATVLFVATWLQMMLTILFAQQYQTVADVLRIWINEKSLEFFESRCQCCGVLGPDDYILDEMDIPLSCYQDRSGREGDLYQSGCSTHYIKPSFPIIQVISFVVQYVLVICIEVFLILLKRSRGVSSQQRTEMFGSLNT